MPLIDDLLDRIGLSNDRILLSALEQLAEGVIVADEKGRLVFVNSAAAEIHGVKRLDVEPEDYADVYRLLTSEGEPYPPHDLPLSRAVEKGETVTDAHWKIRRPDGAIVDAVGTARPVFDENDRQVGAVLTMADMTAEFATRRELDAALTAKETLLYEVNHRVKNNLALVSAMLRLQAQMVRDESARAALHDLSGRIVVLEDLHRRLYQTGGHNEIEVVSFLSENATDCVKAMVLDKQVDMSVRTTGRAMFTVDKAVPLILAMNEMILNSVKHAFARTQDPMIAIDIHADETRVRIDYQDNGCGLPDPHDPSGKGVGRALIANLIHQLQATKEVKANGEGFKAEIIIPLSPQ